MLSDRHFKFGGFELDTAKRLLLKDGQPVHLHSKSFDLLRVLVENRDQVLTKDELLEKVWPGQFVEEGNLSVQIFTLRKIFGEQKNDHRFIVTVPGRGYRFVAELESEPTQEVVIERHSSSRIVLEETTQSAKPSLLRARSLLWVVPGLLAAIGGAYAFYAGLLQRGSTDLSASPLHIRRLTNAGKASIAALSPNGDLFVYALGTTGHPTSLWLGHTAGGEPREVIPPADVWYHDVHFSPDGGRIYYVMSVSDRECK